MPNPFETTPGNVAGQSLSLSGSRSKADASLPQPNAIKHFWDLGDLSQLSLDVAGLLPADEHGDLIARIDDKGNDPTPLIQAVVDRRPTIDKSEHNIICGLFDDSVLTEPLVATGAGASFAVAAFWNLETGIDDNQRVLIWDSVNECSITPEPNLTPVPTNSDHDLRISDANNTFGPTANGVFQWNGGILEADSSPLQTLISNLIAAPHTETNAHNPPDNTRPIFMGGATDASPPSAAFGGKIGAIIIWDGHTPFTDAEIAQIKQFGNKRYNMVWA